MKTKALPTRRTFACERDGIDYLYHKLLYWLYERGAARRALRFAARLEPLLAKAAPGAEAIFPEECRSSICEVRGDLTGAIRHRENEVRLIRRLHEISRRTPSRDYVLRGYGFDDLSDRLDLLAILYHDNGDRDRAIQTLRESRRLCARHGIPFDGAELLKDYGKEKRGRLRPPARPAS